MSQPHAKSASEPYKWYQYLSLNELAPQVQSPLNRTNYVKIKSPFVMPSDVARLETILDEVANRADISEDYRPRIIRDILVNFCSALVAGRLCDKVTVLLIGETGQGKSTTINKLIGQQLLKTGRDQSTTKDIHSVVVPAARNGVSVALAFDDTPGLQDTTVADREINAIIFKRYCDKSFTPSANTKTVTDLEAFLTRMKCHQLLQSLKPTMRSAAYPNAILLTTRWDHIKRDAHNKLGNYTTPIGRAIWAMRSSRLYDEERPNVIIVVTRALSDPVDYLEDDRGTPGFNREWREESSKKRNFISAIQKAVFPDSRPWPVVFVENWANPRKFGKYDMLPNGERSHQNLFDAMRDLFDREDRSGGRDLLGLQALATVISGADPHATGAFETTIVQSRVSIGEGITEDERRLALAHIGETQTPPDIPTTQNQHSYSPHQAPQAAAAAQPQAVDDLNRAQNAQRTGAILERNQDEFWIMVLDRVKGILHEVGVILQALGPVIQGASVLARPFISSREPRCTIQ